MSEPPSTSHGDPGRAPPARLGSPRAGGQQDPVGVEGQRLVDGDLVVADDDRLGPQLTQVLDEVVGKRIVVVDNE